MSPLVKLGLDTIVAIANNVPEIAAFVGRAIAAATDTDEGPLGEYVESRLSGDGYSAAMSAKIRARKRMAGGG